MLKIEKSFVFFLFCGDLRRHICRLCKIFSSKRTNCVHVAWRKYRKFCVQDRFSCVRLFLLCVRLAFIPFHTSLLVISFIDDRYNTKINHSCQFHIFTRRHIHIDSMALAFCAFELFSSAIALKKKIKHLCKNLIVWWSGGDFQCCSISV